MRPRNVLTQTNDMRRLMGLPLLKENSGDSIKDIKKKTIEFAEFLQTKKDEDLPF